jgi:hypothetical protein
VSGLTSNANLTGFKYGNIQTVGEQYPSIPISAATGSPQTIVLNQLTSTTTVYNPTVNRQASNAISLNQIASTTNIYLPAVVQAGGTQTVTLDRIASTTQIYLPTVTRQASKLVSLNRLESTSQTYLPTVVQAAGPQTVTLNRLNSTTQIYLPTILQVSNIIDTSDILSRGLKRKKYGLTQLEEEQIAAQLLKQRQPKIQIEAKHTFDWQKLISNAVNDITNVDELNALQVSTEGITSPSATTALLTELDRQKELRRAELELKQKEEMQAYLEAIKAEKEYKDFKQKRDNRIKRLKALMWLAKLDL